MDDSIEIQAPEEVLGPKERRVVSRTRWLVTSQSQSPTSLPRVTVPAGCKRKWSHNPGPMARPGRKRGRIVITTIPEIKIGAEAIISTPETVVLPDIGRNGITSPVAIPVFITVQHQLQDGPVIDAGSGVHRPAQQLLPVLVTVIQRDSRDHCVGLMPRTGYAVQRPSWQPHSCRSARPPVMVIGLVIRDQHNRHVARVVDVVQQSSPSIPRHGASNTYHSNHPAMLGNTGWRCTRMHSTRPNRQPRTALGIGNRQPTSRSRRRWPWILKNWQEDLPFYASLADSMVASVISELSLRDERTKLLKENLGVIQEAQVAAMSSGFGVPSNLLLLRRDALLLSFGF